MPKLRPALYVAVGDRGIGAVAREDDGGEGTARETCSAAASETTQFRQSALDNLQQRERRDVGGRGSGAGELFQQRERGRLEMATSAGDQVASGVHAREMKGDKIRIKKNK